MNGRTYQQEIAANGFTVIDNVFTDKEVDALIVLIQQTDSSNATFRKTKDLFAIRQFLKEVPDAIPAVFMPALMETINELFGEGYQVVKSIYFDKTGDSNWFVSYHQDLTISVKEKADVPEFGPWTVKQQQYAVQPPLTILETNFTIRIHLDETDEHNGALRVIPGSHSKGIYRPETIDWSKETEVSCNVRKGGIMIMRPLLLHASSRTSNNHKRRVIHIEFSNQALPAPLQWSELLQ
jgi:ectoine hydroxylase-related dioxygenase (phytanoyl-CoA dioxygenase family)